MMRTLIASLAACILASETSTITHLLDAIQCSGVCR